mmetsp:Transcript_93208/g.136162  ORF Transcript_93208/g.136162 Transcript_93208/m.136162 type:complete len:155 (+) Transcript_93208:143-607(+)
MTHLDASHNQLNSLPEDIDRMWQLQELRLEFNFIVVLPVNVMLLKNLRTLNVRQNRLIALPGPASDLEIFLPQLIFLDASHNLLQKVPSGLTCLKNLEMLSLSNNQLSSAPIDMAGCTALVNLDLSNNCLNAIPDVSGCSAMKSFDSHGNKSDR